MAQGSPYWVDAVAEQYVGPYMQIYFKKITTWEAHHVLAFVVLVLVTLELMVSAMPLVFRRFHQLPVNPKLHLEEFTAGDKLYVFINKVSIVAFAYHMFRVMTLTPTVKWRVEEATLCNSLLVLVPMFLLYDFAYSLFHKFLHVRWIYGFVHKHHHRQISPSRGHYDAINVHPLEFLVGEYLNLFCFWAIPCHVFGVLLFVFMAILMATLNHARYDVCVPGLYDSKDHLVHHRLPDTNFGQYTMFWDKLYGWHRGWSESFAKTM